jgi:hypothetical protein
MASNPYAGMAWMHMQVLLGLKRLGHEVYYFEVTSVWPYNPILHSNTNDPEYSVNYLNKLFSGFNVEGHWALRSSYSDHGWYGMSKQKAEDLLKNADLVFNVSGSTNLINEGLKTGRLVLFGTDPVHSEVMYSQNDAGTVELIDIHHDVITYGENIGKEGCIIPPLPRLRGHTRQAVVIDYWKGSKPTKNQFTSVGNWKQDNNDIVLNGEKYFWSKHHEFLKFLDMPTRTAQPIEMATNVSSMGIHVFGQGTAIPAWGCTIDEYDLLTSNGWKLVDAHEFSTDPWKYREYIQSSRAEFTFAKDQNIRLRSGWFSERSASYLASGRPVITQDTGFDSVLPVGVGLFSFNTMDEILSAIDAINSDYDKHSKAAFEIAEQYFKAETVMEKVLNDLGY